MPPFPSFHKFKALRPGDTVAVVAPASAFDRDSFDAGLAVVSERYRVRYDEGIFSRHRYLAGDDARRLSELTTALADPVVKAVFCARGGYGAMRLLPRLEGLAAVTKPVLGFSDITALHLWLQSKGCVSVHAPVMTQLGKLREAPRLFSLLESVDPAAPLVGSQTYVGGIAEGPLLGGNLSVFTRLLGTPYMPSLEGSLLLLEDLSEQPYKLDRMWTHLELAGVFRQIRGVVLGEFLGCEPRDGGYTAADVLRELAVASGVPCAAGFPVGHGNVNEAVPLGVRVRLDAGARRLEFLEGAAG